VKVVGLTGGIATGKSTVGRMMAARGVPVVDADQVARQVVEPGQPALAALVEAMGADILDDAGRLNRSAMRARISRDPQAKRMLESITHPAILAQVASEVARHAAGGADVVVVEAALMVETGSYRGYAALVVVTCSAELQLQRVMQRDGMSEADARALIATQLPLADKEAVATHLVRNEGSLEALEAQVDGLMSTLRQG